MARNTIDPKNVTSGAGVLPARHAGAAPLGSWLDQHAVIMLIAAVATVVLVDASPIAWLGALSFAAYAMRARHVLRDLRPYGGYANHLTATRLLLMLAAAVWLTELSRVWLTSLFALNVLLDIADGYVARRSGQTSELGTMLDREVDGIFVLVAYAYFYCTGSAGAWILLPGALPYLYRLGFRLAQHATVAQTREPLAARLAGVNFVILVTAVALPGRVQETLIWISAAVVFLSFVASLLRMRLNEAKVY